MRVTTRSAIATILLLGAATCAGAAAEKDKEAAPDRPPADIERREATSTLTDSLQGQEGVRIQTLCTHCNSANIQVGGLSQELAPICRDGYPLIGGLATSLVLSILPADTVADAEVRKGPGAGGSPSAAAGGVMLLTGSTPEELPIVDFQALGGAYGRRAETIRIAGPLSSVVSGSLVAGVDSADTIDDDRDGFNDVGELDREFAEGLLRVSLGDHEIDVGATWISEDTLDGRGAFDLLAIVEPTPRWTREDSLVNRTEYRAGWDWSLGKGRSLDVRILDADRDQSQLSQPTSSSPLEERLRIEERDRWMSARYEHPIGLGWLLQGGIELQEEEVSAESEGGFAVDGLDQWTGFVSTDWNLNPQWSVGAEVRFDDATWERREPEISGPFGPLTLLPRGRSDRHTSPRISVRYTPRPGWSIDLNAGGTFRAPRSIFKEVCCGQRYQRNTLANAETGTTIGVEAVYQPSPDLRASVYVSRAEFDDHLLRLVGWSEFYTQTYVLGNIPESRADTAELTVRWSPVRVLTLDGSFSWLSHHNRGDRTVSVPVQRFAVLQSVPLSIDRVPYQPVRSGSFSATYSFAGGASITAQAGYTGQMLVQQFELFFSQMQNGLRDELRHTPGFWLTGLSARWPVTHRIELVGGVDNLSDRIQNDLKDQTTDFNWGPLSGTAWRFGLRFHLDR